MNKNEIIYSLIVENIEKEVYCKNSALPSEQKLCEVYKASRVTVRKALSNLERDGYIRKQQGKGSIVIRTHLTSKTVLLIIPDVFRYIFSDLIKGIEYTLRSKNISLLIANSYNDQNIERSIIRNHIDKVDAIIFEPAQVNSTKYKYSKTYEKLLSKPTICINSKIPNTYLHSLSLSDKEIMELVSNYVLSQNKKKILIFAKTDDLQGSARLHGIENILSKSSSNYLVVEFNTENEAEKLENLAFLYRNFKPDCIMFYNDEYAYKFLTNYNINPIVDDILITGFDNTEYSNGQPYRFISPNHPKGKMGIDAANMIIKMLDGEQVESKVYESDIDFNK
ncbi:MAG: GntR family transcriptional regulator [Coprobacillaceae bacterium]